MRHFYTLAALVLLLQSGTIYAQSEETNNVYKFQTFLFDSQISENPYGEGGFSYSNYDFANSFGLGVQGGLPVNEYIELGGSLGFQNFNPEGDGSSSGLTDLLVSGRYLVLPGQTNISVGGYVTLPIGSEDIGNGNLNFGGFGALRHALDSGVVITGILGLDLLETSTFEINPITFETEESTSHEASLLLGGGGIFPVNEQFHVVGELTIRTETEFTMLSGGVDYQLDGGGKLRGGLGIGLDDGAPDVTLFGSYFMNLN
jgi:hypothetical protein